MQEAILGVDVGTSALKGVVYDRHGAVLFTTQRPYRLATPQPGWAELDMEAVWRALVDVLRAASAAVTGQARIVGLALAAQAGSVVPVDSAGTPLAPMITWLDSRAEPLVAAWQADGTAARIRERSGWHPHPGLPIASIAWLVRHRPAIAERAHRFLDVHDYLVLHLTGRCVTDRSAGAVTAMIDQATGAWSAELCALAGIRPAQLAELAPAGTVVGSLAPEVAQATGLSADTTVIVGGHDQSCAALGMGITSAGQVMLAAGTAWVITALTDNVTIDRIPPRMDLNFHVAPNVRTVSQLLGGYGATVEWWLNMAWNPVAGVDSAVRADRYGELDRTLRDSEIGAHDLLFLPLGGSSQLAAKKPLGGFVGLRLDHSRADMARAILEGVAFEVRWTLDTMAASGLYAGQLWMSGGATRSPIWPAILADVTGIPLLVAGGANWPARGAALLAALGCGICPTVEEAAGLWPVSLERIEPDESTRTLYDDYYRAYMTMVRVLSAPQLGEEAHRTPTVRAYPYLEQKF